jgi:hypothetical protein
VFTDHGLHDGMDPPASLPPRSRGPVAERPRQA